MHYRVLLALVLSVSMLAGCGGGGGGYSSPGGGGGNGGGGGGSTLSQSGGSITLPTSNGITPTFTYPSSTISGSVKVTFTATGSAPAPFSKARLPQAGSSLAAYSMTFSGNTSQGSVTFNGALTLSYSGTASNLILEIFDVSSNFSGNNPVATCPETSSSGTITFTCSNSTSIPSLSDPFVLEIVSGSNLVSANAFICPTSDSPTSIARSGASAAESTHHGLARLRPSMKSSTGQIAVVYDRSTFQRSSASFARNEQSAGGSLTREFDYPRLGKTVHVLNVSASQSATAIAALRSQAGVLSVSPTQRRYPFTSQPMTISNHYFAGFTAQQTGSVATNTAFPFEASDVPGQWDMHAIRMEYAFGYSQPGNTAPLGTNGFPNALGTHSTKIAIIDTGQDTAHPDLSPNIIYQRCFITPVDVNGNPTGAPQSTSDFTTDPFGHGTNVTGIAAAVTNPSNIPATTNAFVGAGGNSAIMAYRVFPTPDDTCPTNNPDNQFCGAQTTDIADAINDAVTNGASVISMSLGGNPCVSAGVDPDPIEGTAVANAISHNVIVVAASGNEGTSGAQGVDSPACDAGVIAAGATSLDDGQPNLTDPSGGNAGGTANAPVEYVVSYSNAGSTNVLDSPTSWGIVAPGGDPLSNMDNDDLHWIENTWTSTPYMSNSSDTSYLGDCNDDYPSTLQTAPVDCRTLIAGTSMATPHVAGVAALICGLNAADCNPTTMKMLLCSTADSVNSAARGQGCGRLDAYRAVAVALGDADPGPPTPPL